MKPIFYFIRKIYYFSGNVLIFNFIGMIFIGLLESVGIVLIIPLLSISGILDIGSKEFFVLSWLIDYFQAIPKTQSLSVILSLFVVIIIVQAWFSRHQTILNKKIQEGFIRQLRQETYKNLIQANWKFFLEHRNSDIVKIMTTEIGNVKKGLSLSLEFLSSLVFAVIHIMIAFWLSPKMTVFILFLGILLLLFSRYFVTKSKQFGIEQLELSRIYIAGITDHLNGIKDIKGNTLEVTHVEWLYALCKKVEHNTIEFVKLRSNSQFIYRVVSAVLLAVFVFFLIEMFQSQRAQLILVVVIFSRLWPIVTRIQSSLENLASIIPSFEALLELQDQTIHAQELKDEYYYHAKAFHLKEGLSCQSIYFQYNLNEDVYALKDVNLHIPANDMTAIVGPSGAGKSTLVDILMGLNQAQQGKVFIDGVALSHENLVSLRRSIGYVPQDPFLFNASLRDNLLLIEPTATEEQLWEALAMASALEFVKKLPDGLDTLIGDRGIRISGGERQRIVLARALVRKPAILILDEATSALDTETELKVKETLDRLRGSITMIIIAHRLSTIRSADQVIVLDQGEIIQKGRFTDLVKDKNSTIHQLLGRKMEALPLEKAR